MNVTYQFTTADLIGIVIVIVIAGIYWWNWPRGPQDRDSDV